MYLRKYVDAFLETSGQRVVELELRGEWKNSPKKSLKINRAITLRKIDTFQNRSDRVREAGAGGAKRQFTGKMAKR